MLFAEVVAASSAVAATRARTTKISAIADLLRRAAPDEIPTVVGLLAGELRQGRIGIGWSTLASLDRAGATPAAQATITVGELDRRIESLARISGPGSQAEVQRHLGELFAALTQPEQAHLAAVFSGGLRQGALEGVVVEGVARAAGLAGDTVRRALMLSGDLGVTARAALTGGEPVLRAIGLHVGRPVRPMLASTAGSVGEALGIVGRASVEWKLDGARIQAHRDGDRVLLVTRNLNDVSARLPEVCDVVRSLPADRLVLDGEVIGLDEDAMPRLFQHTMADFGTQDRTAPTDRAARAATLEPFFFDLLHVDGVDLVDAPLAERLGRLGEVAGSRRIPGVVTDDADVAADFLADSLARGHEGVMVKAVESTYEAGRRGKAWLKVKPVRTLDLVVLAAEWGHGRRRGWLSNLHLGARDPGGGPTGGYVMVGKTFKGLTDELLTWQTAELLARETHREGITVFVRPELVVEIALDGVQASPRYPGGVALRFARVKRYRPDKTPVEADTIETVQHLLART